VKGIRLVGAIVVLLLPLGSSIALAEQTESETQGSGSLPPGAESLPERTANSETFSLPDGQLETKIYPAPVNYRDEEGNWRPINEDLQEGNASAFANGQNSFDLALPEQLDAGAVRVSTDDGWISSQLLGADTQAAEVESNSASYEAAHGDLEFQLSSLANGLKEDIVLADRSQPSEFSYLLKSSAGLTPERSQDGSIVFLDGEGERVFVLPAPIMLDSQPGFPDISDDIEYGLVERGAGEWLLTIEADREWIESPDRVWPIRLDPSLTIPTPSLDCDYLLYNASTSVNVGCGSTGFNKLRAQYKPAYNGAAQERERSVLKFDTSSIPSGAIVTEATVGLFAPYEPLGISGIELRRATQSWDSNVTWTKANATTSWTTAGGTFNAEGSEILTSERKELEGWWNFSKGLAPVVQGWASGTMSNQGLVIKLKNEEGCQPTACTNSWATFNSSAATDSTKRPYLSVVYGIKPSATAEAATLVSETGATLKGQVNPNGAETKYQFEYGTTTSYGTKVPGTAESVGSGTTNVAVSKAISGLTGNTLYHYRVSATNANGTTFGLDETLVTPKLPTLTTEAATGVTASAATLKGSINPNGWAASYQFEYGLTTSYGTSVPVPAASTGWGTTPVAVSKTISGLQEGGTYHYRLTASNPAGSASGADKTFTTPDPPETTITSPMPTYTEGQPAPVQFTSDEAGSTFKCSIDNGQTLPLTTCQSPYTMQSLQIGWHTFEVVATDSSGLADPTPAEWTFSPAAYPPAPATSKIDKPTEGQHSGKYFTLSSVWKGTGVTSVTYQLKYQNLPWTTIDPKLVTNAVGSQVSWPVAVAKGASKSPLLYFDASSYKYFGSLLDDTVQVRALLDGTSEIGSTASVNIVDDPQTGGPRDATAPMGPGNVDLVTGNFTLARTDVSIPAFNSNLEFSRSRNSREPQDPGVRGVLGSGWKPSVSLQAAGNLGWRGIYDANAAEEGEYAVLIDPEGYEVAFEMEGLSYASPPEAPGWKLSREDSTHLVLADPNGNRTVFKKEASSFNYLPESITMPGGSGNKQQINYQPNYQGELLLSSIVAPSPPGLTCTETNAATTLGCRSLTFYYEVLPVANEGKYFASRLVSITYHGPKAGGGSQGEWEVSRYAYDADGNLIAQWDPRISPELKETYTYEGPRVRTITPPGQLPWTLNYVSKYPDQNALRSVSRPSLVSSPSVAETTVAYNVPVSGSGAPYDLGYSAISKWGQKDLPRTATAIFPPSEVPAEPPSSYSRATVYYMDADGQTVNTVAPAGAGISDPPITTTETDEYGNVTRELTPQNRIRALAAGSESQVRSEELDTLRHFSFDGTELEWEWGPRHAVRLESGEVVQARMNREISYDEGAPTPPAGTPKAHLPTRERTAAFTGIIPLFGEFDAKVTETKYDWTLRKPIETILDPGKEHLELKTRIAYDAASGLPTERSLPAEPKGGDAHTMATIYYTTGANALDSSCGNNYGYASLPCKTMPAKQPGTAGVPELLVTRYASYNYLGQPTEVIESPGGKEEAGKTRKTTKTYDEAGRETTSRLVGGGTELLPTATVYNKTTGLPEERKFTCEGKCEGFDSQSVVIAYDELGRPIKYTDADGSTSETTYDLLGRPAKIYDGKGTQTFGYDETSGLLVAMNDSAAGTFTASYDADGRMLEEGLPNGLVAKMAYDEAGQPTKLSYTKVVSCSEKCTWLEESNERSIYGQILSQTSLSSSQQYSYDKAGRLTLVQDTPKGGSCTTRQYVFDADSNRTKMTTRAPGVGGACDTKSTGTSQEYKYDAADRLIGPETVNYDSFGRITSLPAKFAGGSTLTTTFYSNNMVASQSQGGLTNTYQLDATGRPRQVAQMGTKTGTEVFHYAMASDSTAWTERGGTWTRSVRGIGAGLAAIQESSGTTSLQLTNLHGDVVATASLSLTAKEPTATFDFDEFGNPKKGSAGRYGWLGGKSRRTELPSGVIQMGVRSYVPALGRFLSTDPIPGASANAYDYSNANPITGFDLTGTSPYDSACLPGFAGCKCKMWAKFTPGRRGRIVLTTVRKCNVAGGITLGGLASGWGKGNGDGFHSIPPPRPVNSRIEPACRSTDPCQNYQKHVREFYCEPGKEYEFSQTWEFQINVEGLPAHTLDVKIEEFCPQ
jgi:RHS repeat-associated protein